MVYGLPFDRLKRIIKMGILHITPKVVDTFHYNDFERNCCVDGNNAVWCNNMCFLIYQDAFTKGV